MGRCFSPIAGSLYVASESKGIRDETLLWDHGNPDMCLINWKLCSFRSPSTSILELFSDIVGPWRESHVSWKEYTLCSKTSGSSFLDLSLQWITLPFMDTEGIKTGIKSSSFMWTVCSYNSPMSWMLVFKGQQTWVFKMPGVWSRGCSWKVTDLGLESWLA